MTLLASQARGSEALARKTRSLRAESAIAADVTPDES
jgi:hypothetical protein